MVPSTLPKLPFENLREVVEELDLLDGLHPTGMPLTNMLQSLLSACAVGLNVYPVRG